MIDAPPVVTMTPIEQAEAFVAATGAQIEHGGTRAFYPPSTDSIQLPPRETFIGSPTSSPAESYSSTVCHELTHWTSAESAATGSLENASAIMPMRWKNLSPSWARCVPIALTASDLDRLEADIQARRLPQTEGFFFGASDGLEIDDDLSFVAKARQAITAGLTVYYTSWW